MPLSGGAFIRSAQILFKFGQYRFCLCVTRSLVKRRIRQSAECSKSDLEADRIAGFYETIARSKSLIKQPEIRAFVAINDAIGLIKGGFVSNVAVQ
jgi:hypothetical protein